MRAVPENANEGKLSRRNFLEAGSAALAAAGVNSVANLPAADQNQPGYARRKSDPGPTNPEIDAQNSSSFDPPETDAGGIPPFKYPFSFRTSACIAAVGRAKSQFANCQSPKAWPA
jgi:oxalate decarboxylase